MLHSGFPSSFLSNPSICNCSCQFGVRLISLLFIFLSVDKTIFSTIFHIFLYTCISIFFKQQQKKTNTKETTKNNLSPLLHALVCTILNLNLHCYYNRLAKTEGSLFLFVLLLVSWNASQQFQLAGVLMMVLGCGDLQ